MPAPQNSGARRSASGRDRAQDAATRYGLAVLAENIEDRSDNQTRFLGVAALRHLAAGTPARTSCMFTTANQPERCCECSSRSRAAA